MERFRFEHVFIKISYCIFKIVKVLNYKMKEKFKFLNLRGLSTESFLAIWLSQYKYLIKEFLIGNCVCQGNTITLQFCMEQII